MKVYGKKQIVMEKDEVDEIKKFDDPGLVLMGFKPMDRLKRTITYARALHIP